MSRILLLACLLAGPAFASGRYLDISFRPSDKAGDLALGVTYTIWLPDGVKTIRGVIVHQHGCGSGACKGGATAAYDLHWQALAKKHSCALLGPSYHQQDKDNCRLWCDPRNGSVKTFLAALDHFAEKAGHPELKEAPWCLWGHSGGGFWASIMQTLHPNRCVAVWLRSGNAFSVLKPDDIPAAAYEVPVVCNPGVKERDDKRFKGAWTGAVDLFRAFRAKEAPICFAPDPRTGHECGDSRYLAIPFFDACLTARLPEKGAKLRPMPTETAWLAASHEAAPVKAADFKGDVKTAIWLPDERIAKAWAEYVKVGSVGDKTPPPAPTQVKVARKEGGNEITWAAEADLESGLRGFVILRDGKEIAQLPAKPVGRFGRPLFQTMSYHDTPEQPLPAMRFVDAKGKDGAAYAVIAVNSVGLKSAPGPTR